MKATIGKQFRFEAAHRLPYHDGKCKNIHGHSYKVEIILFGDIQTEGPKQGMVVDFGDLSSYWKVVLDPLLDHQLLNVFLPNPTAELLAVWIYNKLGETSFSNLVERVRVWETPTSYAEFS